jgi:Lon protease-like protein
MDPAPQLADLPSTVYLLAIDRFILLPETTLPIKITHPPSCEVLDAAEAESGYVGVIQTRGAEKGADSRFYAVGCLARIRSLDRDEQGHRVALEGVIRFRVRQELSGEDGLPRAAVSYEEFAADLGPAEEDPAGWNPEGFKAALLKAGKLQSGRETSPLESMSPRQLVRVLAQTAPLATAEKQALLEARSFREFLELLFQLLAVNFLTTTPDTSPSSQAN